MSEDLEKIKQLCDVEVPYNEVCSIHANDLGEIQEAAERMAAEIERLENEMNTLMNKNLPEEMREMHRRQKEYIQHQRQHLKNMTRKYKNSLESKQKALRGMSKAIDSRDFDISRLKAELEKRPEVVKCGECINYHCGIYTSSNNVENSQPPCCYYFGIHVNDNDFCSRGQRRESEEGK